MSVILFSPRSLLPGQMNTNAFRSSTDKEWTRFRGSNVSGLSLFLSFSLAFFLITFASFAVVSTTQVCVKYDGCYETH